MENTATNRESQLNRITRMRQMHISQKNRVETSQSAISKATMREYNLNSHEASRLTKELVLAPRSSSLKIGDESSKVAEVQMVIANSIEREGQRRTSKRQAGDAEYDSEFQRAHSLETLTSETSSSQEYFSWFEETDVIIKNINDGFASEDDIQAKNKWIDDSYDREAELMTVLGLYQSSKSGEAKKKYDEIYNKLVKLRQLRSGMKEATQEKPDNPEKVNMQQKEAARAKAAIYRLAIKKFTTQEPNWNLQQTQLQKLKMHHADDEELAGDYASLYAVCENEDWRIMHESDAMNKESYAFDDMLKEQILFQWEDDRSDMSFMNSRAEDFVAEMSINNKEDVKEGDIVDTIERLRGRRFPVKDRAPLSYDMDRAKAFDSSRFNVLDKKQYT